jgi:hypothetical protein
MWSLCFFWAIVVRRALSSVRDFISITAKLQARQAFEETKRPAASCNWMLLLGNSSGRLQLT